MLSSGLKMKLLVLISYYKTLLILNILHISEHQTQPFDDKRIYFFLNTKRHSALLYQTVLILYQSARLDAEYHTHVPQCNNPLTVFLSNANIHQGIK